MPKITKKAPRFFSMERIVRASQDYSGFCLGCGDEQDCVEPDGRQYECEGCGEFKVYGAEELVLMGLAR